MEKKKNIFRWMYLASALMGSLFSQTVGRVFEIKSAKDTLFLSEIQVYSFATRRLTYTDSLGKFMLNHIPPDDTLDISGIGYTRQRFIIKNPGEFLFIKLNAEKQLNEIEIVYQRPAVEYSLLNPMMVQTLNEQYLQKAACCNLSESFETNASIDIQLTDAITGIRQIQLNGLSGKYVFLTRENMPYLFGVQSAYGLNFLPGPFIQSIQLSKGPGSVLNGYESFSGQINTELWSPNASEFKIYFNQYLNQNGRNEYNLMYNQKISKNFHTNFLLHSSFNPLAQDMNHDGFVDIPVGRQYNVVHKYYLKNSKGLDWQWGGQFILDDKISGQIIKNFSYQEFPYLVHLFSQRADAFSKLGWIFRNKPGHSIGLQTLYSAFFNTNRFDTNLYKVSQNAWYANLIYQGIFRTTSHTYRLGFTGNQILPRESFMAYAFQRNEILWSVFGEYNYIPSPSLSFLAGSRLTHHRYYGWIYTPRIHIKWNSEDMRTTIKMAAGRSYRTPNPLSENIGTMASRRKFYFLVSDSLLPYGWKGEDAWTGGINIYRQFTLFYRPASLLLEYYYTHFTHQYIADLDTPGSVFFYSTSMAYAHTSQIEWQFQPIRRWEVLLSARYIHQKSLFAYGWNEQPFIPRFRSFANVVYNTRNKHWNFDFTLHYTSSKRLPNTSSNPPEFRRDGHSQPFWNILAQITYSRKWNHHEIKLYAGVENLNNFRQPNPIVSYQNPSSTYFDASIIWSSVYGRMIYGGIRYYLR